MKNICLIAAWLLVGLLARAQAPGWRTLAAVTNVSSDVSVLETVAAADDGSLYVAGHFRGTMQVGATTLTGRQFELTAFVAKWSPVSGFVWARQVGPANTPQHALAKGIAVSGGSVYVATSNCVAKLTDAGSSASVVWLQPVAGISALAVSGSSVYIASTFADASIALGPYTLTNQPPSSYPPFGTVSLYVAKLTDAGSTASFTWAQQATGRLSPESDGAWPDGSTVRLAVANGNVYVSGYAAGQASFGATTIAVSGGSGGFVAKLADAGASATWTWAERLNGTGSAIPLSLAVQNNRLYLAGLFFGAQATFGSTTLTQVPSSPYNNAGDAFVTGLTDTGPGVTHNWALRAGGTGRDSASALLATPSGLYVAGRFSSPTADFGTTILTNTGPVFGPGYTNPDVYVARIVETGSGASFAWAQSAGSPYYDRTGGLALSNGTLYLTGESSSAGHFGTLSLPSNSGGFIAGIADQALPTRAGAELPGLAIYPNPAHGAATVRVPAGAGAATVQVLDALGRVVRQAPVVAGTDYPLALTGLASGLYAVRVQVGEATATQRLAVE